MNTASWDWGEEHIQQGVLIEDSSFEKADFNPTSATASSPTSSSASHQQILQQGHQQVRLTEHCHPLTWSPQPCKYHYEGQQGIESRTPNMLQIYVRSVLLTCIYLNPPVMLKQRKH